MTLFSGDVFASEVVSASVAPKADSAKLQPVRKSSANPKTKNTKTKSMKNSFEVPDFAFPRDVEANAEKALARATSEGNWSDAVRAVIQMTIARDMVSNDNALAQALMIDSLALKAPEPYRSLLYLLEGGLYQSMFNSGSWKFRSRTLPLDVFPENPMDWSGDLFALKVLSLVEKGQQNYNDLSKIPLKEIAPLLTDTSSAVAEGMTVEDFMCVKSADLLSDFIFNSDAVIPFGAPSAGNRSVSDRCRDCLDMLLRRRYDLDVAAGNVASAVRAAVSLAEIQPHEQRLPFALDALKKFDGSDKMAPLLSYISDFYDVDSNLWFGRPDVGASGEDRDYMSEVKAFYKTLTDFRSAHPGAPYISGVENAITKLSRQNVSLSMDHQWLTTKAVADTVKMINTDDLYLLLVKLPARFLHDDITRASLVSSGKIVDTRHVAVEGEVPFVGEAAFDFGVRPPGIYAVIPSLTKDFSGLFPTIGQRDGFSRFIVSDITAIRLSNSKSDNRLIVVGGKNMAPVKGADVSVVERNWGKPNRIISQGKTDVDGCFVVPTGSYDVRVSYGENLYSSNFYSGRGYNNPEKVNYNAKILTDLSIYHPGDSVGFAAVVYSIMGQEVSLEKNCQVEIKLRDANWEVTDSLTLTTDSDGRIEGRFRIPSDVLLGNYSIVAYLTGGHGSEIGTGFFQVADYKSPTFKVSLEGDSESVEIGDVVRIKGKVMTYSGLPLSGVDVNFNVKYEPAWWFWRSAATNASYGASVKSDAEGNFVIELPTASLKGTPYSRGTFSLVATAVSPSGESQESAPYRFVIGKTASVGLDRMPETLCVAESESKPSDIDIPVYNALRTPVKGVDVEWNAVDENGVEVASGSFKSPEFEFDFASLSSGRYKFTFFPHEMPENKKSALLVVYRKSDRVAPYATPLWLPEKSISIADDVPYADLCVGSAYPDSHVLCSVAGSDGSSSWRWLEVNAENKSVRVDLSGSAGVTHVSLMGMHDLDGISDEVVISRRYMLRSMKIESESFRDRINPGDREQWRFRMTVDGNPCIGDAAMAVMSNQALNAIAPFRWDFNPRSGIRMNFAQSVSLDWKGSYSWNYALRKVKYQNERRFLVPQWDFYGYSLYSGMRYARGRNYMYSHVASANMMVEEAAEYDAALPMANMERKMAKAEAIAAGSSDMVEKESVEDLAGAADAGAYADSEPMREIEMPLAFFRPMLKANSDGVVNIDFIVPNFNTTWQLQLLGYDSQLYSTVATFNTVAAKKVMVQCNAPRFLRSGDVTVISASLFNNSESEVAVGGRIEIFNPLTGEILESKDFSAESVDASGNRSIKMSYSVPSDRNLIGVRAFALGNGHSDGEQTVIDILPSSNPVIESDPFYLAPSQHEFKMKLPKVDADASLTLQYCDNPVWYCVTALPDISNPDSKNLFALLPALFGNAVGLGLADRYPQIRQALMPVEGDSLLVSNLYKNPELKSVALNSTPWVNNAASESLRMSRLQELLDKEKGDEVVKSLLKSISDLQNSDGGWSWCPDMKSSTFMTSAALLNFAMLRDMKCLVSSSDVNSMIDKGIRFCRSEIVKDYYRDPKYFSYESMLNYLYIESFFDVKSSDPTFNSMRSKALKAIAAGWRKYSIYEKATAAILLYRSGRDNDASVILESLGQFASSSPEKGVWFDNLSSGFTGWPRLITTAQALEAFDEINPSSPLVDGLRQWLILSRQTEDWGTNRYTAEVIYSILTSGSDWLTDSAPAIISLNGKQIAIGKRERLTGSISIPLSPKVASNAKLTVSRSGDSPAWGGVISQYVAPIEDIKAASIPDLSVSKEVLLLKSTPDGDVAEKCSEFKVGDKVRVTLTIHCGRDMDYVALTDCRAACMEPVEQLSGYTAVDGLWFYKEIRNTATNIFFDFLPKGDHVISYDCFIDRAGDYSLGIATIQSQYSPLMTAHSAGFLIVSD